MDIVLINEILFAVSILLQIMVVVYCYKLYRITRFYPVGIAWIIFGLSLVAIAVRRSIYLYLLIENCTTNGNMGRFVEGIILFYATFSWFWFMKIKYDFYAKYLLHIDKVLKTTKKVSEDMIIEAAEIIKKGRAKVNE
jgi:hypothetical protein